MVTLVNRAKMSTSTTGTGTITLGSAESGYQSFADAGVSDGDVVRYVIEDGDDWEIGSGTYTATGTTLSRTVDESSNSDAALNLTGSAVVFITAAAEDVFQGELFAENPSSPTAPSATGTNAVAIGTGSISSGSTSVAIGDRTEATANQTVAIGSLNTRCSSIQGVAIGSARASGLLGSVAIGGYGSGYSVASNNYSIALGRSYSSGDASFAAAIANNTSSYGATGANSIAMGYLAKATQSYAFATGYQAQSTGNSAISMGFQANAGSQGVALGYKGRATGGNAFGVSNNTSGGATGSYSIAIGDSCLASSASSVAIGLGSQADAAGSVVLGSRGHAQGIQNRYVFSPRSINGNNDGASQYGVFALMGATTDATAKVLTTNDTTAGTTNQVILPNNSAYSFSGTIIARESAAAGSDYASWEIKGALLRDANAASTVLGNGIKNKLYASAGASAWDIALTADTTNGGLKIEVTGAAATNIRWVATVNTSEVTYA